MAEEKRKSLFDANEAGILVKELRRQFGSGKTKTYEWREAQIKSLSQMIDDREKEIIEALHEDLCKPEFEGFVAEVHILSFSLPVIGIYLIPVIASKFYNLGL